ncbi:kelch repeat-containing protein [Mangrovimonas sp. TPBH4]|uniref:Kelch repeat-containing protein n=1 Tax=Mangrovimonas sp. TPBH4 TaxID=1645914 RepID=UPI0006B62E15|nr:kelch repeat-containing protein [Mangrovimonas sp. TPBH4]
MTDLFKLKFRNEAIKMIAISLACLTMGCSSDDDDDDDYGDWVEVSVFDGVPRSNAVAFTIDNKGYMGTGYDGDDYLNDFWAYDFDGNYWYQLSDLPGVARSYAVAFDANNKGYVGLGYDGETNDELGDFYSYDPQANTWTAIADFGGGTRRGAVAFSSETAGYVGTGYDGQNDKKDFWKYDPSADTWTLQTGFGGEKRREASTFKIDNTVYLGTGVSNGLFQTDFWAFDLDTETWTQLEDLDEDDDYSIVRNNGVGFSMNGKGYFGLGVYSSYVDNAIWEYDPLSDSWEEKGDFEGVARQGSIAFSNGSRAFVALGKTGSLYLDDNYEFFPNEVKDTDD